MKQKLFTIMIAAVIFLVFVVCTFQMTGCRTKQNAPSDEQIITNTLLSDYENHANDINTSNHASSGFQDHN